MMLERREMKLKKYLEPSDLNADDGDHGITSGYVRRGYEGVSTVLHQLYSVDGKSRRNLAMESQDFMSSA